MDLSRNAQVAARFAARADTYDRYATIQASVADRLAEFLPELVAPDVLEVGCGTGLLTRKLVSAYPQGRFLVTDLAPEMLAVCRRNVAPRNGQTVRLALMNAEVPDLSDRFGLIATSMTLQWLSDPVDALARLRGHLQPGGSLVFATLGPDGFSEWRAALAAEGLADGTVQMPELPGVFHEERQTIAFDSALSFLNRIKSIGAAEPRAGYHPLSPGALRAALRRLDREHDARVTWHLVYGRLDAVARGSGASS
ncbi:MAG: methyltransferase [Methyloligellaceae bacterium]